MHTVAYIAGVLNLLYLPRLFDKAQLDDGLYELFTRFGAGFFAPADDLGGVKGEKRRQQRSIVVAARRDKMHLTALQGVFEGIIRSDFLHSTLCGQARNRGHRPHPDDVVEAEVVGVDDFLPTLEVNGRGKARLVNAEEIQPGAVLAPLVAIVPVLCGRVHIA